MTGCDFCENEYEVVCEECHASCCHEDAQEMHGVEDSEGDVFWLCSPDHATWPGRGCYKPPVAEAADDSR